MRQFPTIAKILVVGSGVHLHLPIRETFALNLNNLKIDSMAINFQQLGIKKNDCITCQSGRPPRHSAPGEYLFKLEIISQNRAEGEGFIRINGEILAFDLLVFAYQKKIEVTSEPVTEWWVNVVDDKKEPIGWVLINKKTVFLDRQF
jgi:hypothetical protein